MGFHRHLICKYWWDNNFDHLSWHNSRRSSTISWICIHVTQHVSAPTYPSQSHVPKLYTLATFCVGLLYRYMVSEWTTGPAVVQYSSNCRLHPTLAAILKTRYIPYCSEVLWDLCSNFPCIDNASCFRYDWFHIGHSLREIHPIG